MRRTRKLATGDRYAREGEATITLSWNEASVKISCKARGKDKDHNFQLPRVNYIIEQVVNELLTEVGLEDKPEPKKGD